jgi:hypothetical protein
VRKQGGAGVCGELNLKAKAFDKSPLSTLREIPEINKRVTGAPPVGMIAKDLRGLRVV